MQEDRGNMPSPAYTQCYWCNRTIESGSEEWLRWFDLDREPRRPLNHKADDWGVCPSCKDSEQPTPQHP